MNRPYIVCHMVMSLDGKVTGNFLSAPGCADAVERYYEINRHMKCDGFICGRVTMEESFTNGYVLDLSQYAPVGSETDFLLEEEHMTGFYAVAFDPKGKLGWTQPFIEDEDEGYDRAQIIEVVTEAADKRYLGYLKSIGIPYICAGQTEIDVDLALSKLKHLIGMERLLLEGGSVINGAFERKGAIDALSLVVAPMVAQKDAKPLFMSAVSDEYRLADSKVYDSGAVWLYYQKEKEK